MPYVRKPTEIRVFAYAGQGRDDWPQWLQDYTVYTPLGFAPVVADAIGTLIVPTASGVADNIVAGGFVVWEDGVVTAYPQHKFNETFVLIPEKEEGGG